MTNEWWIEVQIEETKHAHVFSSSHPYVRCLQYLCSSSRTLEYYTKASLLILWLIPYIVIHTGAISVHVSKPNTNMSWWWLHEIRKPRRRHVRKPYDVTYSLTPTSFGCRAVMETTISASRSDSRAKILQCHIRYFIVCRKECLDIIKNINYIPRNRNTNLLRSINPQTYRICIINDIVRSRIN